MTTIDTRPDASALHAVDAPDAAGRLVSGVASWITTADHKRIGRLFIGAALLDALAIAVLGVVLGLERINDNSMIDSGALPQLFSLFRATFPFYVVAPLLIGLAVAVVPLQLGARSLALPRAALFGFYAWGAGGILVDIAYINNGGPGGGDSKMVDLWILGLGLTLLGLVAAAGTVVTSVLTTRAPGMTLRRAPLFAWSSLVGCTGIVLTLPVLLGDLVLIGVDHRYPRAAFGGNEFGSWIAWATTQSATIVYALAAVGIAAELLVVATGRRAPMRGAIMTGIGLTGAYVLSAVTQREHVIRWTGRDGAQRFKDVLPYALFYGLPILGFLAVLGGVAFGLKSSKPKPSSPLVFGMLSLLLMLGAAIAHLLTNVVDLQLQGTVYEEGVFTAVCYSAVLAGLGGVAYWGPKLWGRSIADKAVLPLGLFGALGTVLASVPMMIAGFQGQPADAVSGYDYKISPEILNLLGMVGHAAMGVTILGFVLLAVKSFSSGQPAGDDPWDGQTLEWATSSPPPPGNFADVPTVSSAEPLLDLKPARSRA